MCKGAPTGAEDDSSSNSSSSKTRVAVIGGGVSGLAAAWHLHVNGEDHYDVHLFEAAPRLGGHAHTTKVPVPEGPALDVDIGFMVFNHANYPNMTKWFDALNKSEGTTTSVEEEDSDMSLSVSLDQGESVEWNSDGLTGLFAKPSQWTSKAHWTFISDMMRFHKEASALLLLEDDDPRKHVTVRHYLRQNGYSTDFGTHYLLPVMAALWSASLTDVLDFPAAQLIGFLCNHQMLQIFDRPQWKTVAGRSVQYTKAVLQSLSNENDKEPRVHLSSPVESVTRDETTGTWSLYGVEKDDDPAVMYGSDFDHIIFACHPPTAQKILNQGGSTRSELLDVLGEISYADNVVYVHSDPSLMPQRKHAWASWNCLGKLDQLKDAFCQGSNDTKKHQGGFEGAESGFGNTLGTKSQSKVAKPLKPSPFMKKSTSMNSISEIDNYPFSDVDDDDDSEIDDESEEGTELEGTEGRMKAVYVTYWLNRLQNLKTQQDVFVSLNPHQRPADHLTHHRLILAHPQFTAQTLSARQELQKLQGQGGLWFAGAWSGYGFHEDGCRSGFQVATALSQLPVPWCADIAEKAAVNTPGVDTSSSLVLAPPDLAVDHVRKNSGSHWLPFGRLWGSLYHMLTYDLPVMICKPLIVSFLQRAVVQGRLILKLPGSEQPLVFGNGKPCGVGDHHPVVLRIFDNWWFVKTAVEYDLGLARSYMAGHFVVEPLKPSKPYHRVLKPANTRDEATVTLGDPVGLTRLFLLLIANRDATKKRHVPRKAASRSYSNAMTNAAGLWVSKLGSFLNYWRYKLTMNNSEAGGSLKNIHAHYDLSNDLFQLFLDKDTLMYSCAIYDAVPTRDQQSGLVFRGSLEEAQWRKLDTYLARAQVQPGQSLLDIGFGWGGLCLRAAQKYGCKVTGITLSVEQKALAEQRVKQASLQHLITLEVVDYRVFCRRRRNRGKFDRVVSCEMIEAVGHDHLGEFFWAVEQVLKPNDGILVLGAITTPENRYETYVRSTDFINTIIFPGSCCPSLHALVDAAYKNSCLTLEHIDNIGLHYAETLREWRRRFNAKEDQVRAMGFDDVFLRAWNYYLTYCEAGFYTQTENMLLLVFARPGSRSLAPLCETRTVTQAAPLTSQQVQQFLQGAVEHDKAGAATKATAAGQNTSSTPSKPSAWSSEGFGVDEHEEAVMF